MLTNIFYSTFRNVWPMLFIFTIIIVSIRLFFIFYNKEKFTFYKELLMFFFIIYILLLYYIVTFQDNNYGTNNFIPFKEIFRYNITSRLFFKNVLGNIVLFIPFGIFVTHYVKNKKIYPTLILSFLVSVSIEFTQSVIGRTADIDDVILNLLGGILGYFIYKEFNTITSKLPKIMKTEVFLDLLSLFLILGLIFVSFKYNFWRFFSWTM